MGYFLCQGRSVILTITFCSILLTNEYYSASFICHAAGFFLVGEFAVNALQFLLGHCVNRFFVTSQIPILCGTERNIDFPGSNNELKVRESMHFSLPIPTSLLIIL